MILLMLALTAALGQPVVRHTSAVDHFKQQTGYPKGRPGYVVDHIIPFCAGGPDTPSNMQWQALKASYAKDVYERALCKALKAQGYRVTKIPQG